MEFFPSEKKYSLLKKEQMIEAICWNLSVCLMNSVGTSFPSSFHNYGKKPDQFLAHHMLVKLEVF